MQNTKIVATALTACGIETLDAVLTSKLRET